MVWCNCAYQLVGWVRAYGRNFGSKASVTYIPGQPHNYRCVASQLKVIHIYLLVRHNSTLTTNPLSHQESINVRLDSLRIVNFSNHSKMFYESVTKQGRNSYEYSRDLAKISQNSHDSVTNFLQCAITYLDIL